MIDAEFTPLKRLTYEPQNSQRALQDFMGWMDEMLFENRTDAYTYKMVVHSYMLLRHCLARESIEALRGLMDLQGGASAREYGVASRYRYDPQYGCMPLEDRLETVIWDFSDLKPQPQEEES